MGVKWTKRIATASFFILVFLISTNSAHAATLTVCETGTPGQGGCDYIGGPSIQTAVNDASDGDTVFIKAGTYNDVVVKIGQVGNPTKQNLTIQGEGKEKTILKGRSIVFSITDSTISIESVELIPKYAGSAVWVNTDSQISISNSLFSFSGSFGYSVTSQENSVVDISSSVIKTIIFTLGDSQVSISNSIMINDSYSAFSANHTSSILFENVVFMFIGGTSYHSSTVDIKNSIITDRTTQNAVFTATGDSTITIDYFLEHNNVKFKKTSGNGSVITTNQVSGSPNYINGYHLGAGSPAIDTGDPAILDPDGTRSDLGAYGGLGACLLDPTLIGCSSPYPIPGDTDYDGDVDGVDYIVWLNNYGSTNVPPPGYSYGDFDGKLGGNRDGNGDGNVDGIDYITWLRNYGKIGPTPTPSSIPTATSAPTQAPTSTPIPTQIPTVTPIPIISKISSFTQFIYVVTTNQHALSANGETFYSRTYNNGWNSSWTPQPVSSLNINGISAIRCFSLSQSTHGISKQEALSTNGKTVYYRTWSGSNWGGWNSYTIQSLGLGFNKAACWNQSDGDNANSNPKQTLTTSDGKSIYYRTWTSGSGWSGWTQRSLIQLGLNNYVNAIRSFSQSSNPATGQPKQEVISANGSKHLYRTWTSGSGWSGWTQNDVSDIPGIPGDNTPLLPLP